MDKHFNILKNLEETQTSRYTQSIKIKTKARKHVKQIYKIQ